MNWNAKKETEKKWNANKESKIDNKIIKGKQ